MPNPMPSGTATIANSSPLQPAYCIDGSLSERSGMLLALFEMRRHLLPLGAWPCRRAVILSLPRGRFAP
jgi:hypothetical protein